MFFEMVVSFTKSIYISVIQRERRFNSIQETNSDTFK